MRLLIAALVSCYTLGPSLASGEQEFPYKAFITAENVYVRSGPGQSYYPTDKLKTGQEIEVYRHDPGGWYAIKPPEGSFAWVSGRFLKAGTDGLAVVADDRVAARVGSRLSDIREVIQVRLHKAEVVEVLEAKKTGTGSDRVTWYKIAPPSGEFRWVHGRYVDPHYQDTGVRKTGVTENRFSRAEPPGVERAEPSPVTMAATAELPPAAEPSTVIVRPPSGPVAEPRFVSPGGRSLSPKEYQAALEGLNLKLSAMVVEEPTVWAFDDMRLGAEELLHQAETAVERGRARVLLNKIDRFDDIQRRYDRINLVRTRNERANRSLAGLDRQVRGLARRPEQDERFDGVGKLTRVISRRSDAPRYALVDPSGDVRCYVSPAPGVNLRHYLGRKIGINGVRGYMPEQRAEHVTARNVSVLEGRRF